MVVKSVTRKISAKDEFLVVTNIFEQALFGNVNFKKVYSTKLRRVYDFGFLAIGSLKLFSLIKTVAKKPVSYNSTSYD